MDKLMTPQPPTKEEIAYTRFGDNIADKESEHLFRFPRGQEYRIRPA